jgi:hypothetical protein
MIFLYFFVITTPLPTVYDTGSFNLILVPVYS